MCQKEPQKYTVQQVTKETKLQQISQCHTNKRARPSHMEIMTNGNISYLHPPIGE